MSGWRLAPLRRLEAHRTRAAALALAGALDEEAQAARAVARRLEAAHRAAELARGLGGRPALDGRGVPAGEAMAGAAAGDPANGLAGPGQGQGLGLGLVVPALPLAALAGAAACAARHAEALEEAQAAALRAGEAAEGRRHGLATARAVEGGLAALEARWAAGRRRARQRAEELAAEEVAVRRR